MSDAKLNEGINDDVTVIILSELLHLVAAALLGRKLELFIFSPVFTEEHE